MLAVASFILSKFSMYFSFCFYSILNRHLPLKIVSLCPLSLLLNPRASLSPFTSLTFSPSSLPFSLEDASLWKVCFHFASTLRTKSKSAGSENQRKSKKFRTWDAASSSFKFTQVQKRLSKVFFSLRLSKKQRVIDHVIKLPSLFLES